MLRRVAPLLSMALGIVLFGALVSDTSAQSRMKREPELIYVPTL
jgi:hypothetical protein